MICHIDVYLCRSYLKYQLSRGQYYMRIQEDKVLKKPYSAINFDDLSFDFLQYIRKAYEYATDPVDKQIYMMEIKEKEAFRDFYTGEDNKRKK